MQGFRLSHVRPADVARFVITPFPFGTLKCRLDDQVKCDHRKPICTTCERYGQQCIWPGRKKNNPRREKTLYENVTTRLAQIERLVKDLQEQQPASQAQTSHPRSMSETSSNGVSTDQSTFMRTSPAVVPPQPDANQTSPSSTTSGQKLLSSGAMPEATIGAGVGDRRFSGVARRLLEQINSIPPQRTLTDISTFTDHFPSDFVVEQCMKDFFATLNRYIKFFDESEVRSAVQSYLHGRPPSAVGWKIALYTILLHPHRKRDLLHGTREHERYLQSAMALIPTTMLQSPCPMAIGALLALVSHFIFTAENHIAVSILALATQSILLGGYYHGNHPGLSEAEIQHRRRLFWQAYIFDHDLMIRIGKPPLITDNFLLDLPEEYPLDCYGFFYYPDDVALNYFRQEVKLAQIQGRIYSRLYLHSPTSAAALEAEIGLLDRELQEWRESIPEMVRPMQSGAPLDDDNHARLIALSSLHFIYFQLVVAVHSAALRTALDGQDMDFLRPSVAICVNAARGAVSLLNYHHIDHPFTIYLLYQVAWSVDILFINIIENKTSAIATQDIELIKLVLSFYERYDVNHQKIASYHIIKALHEVGLSVVVDPTNTLQDPLGAALNGLNLTMERPNVNAEYVPVLPVPDVIEQDNWEGISHGSHNWLSAGVLQMVDWGLPPNSHQMNENNL
ncbi:Fusaridione A cluster transcription factor fsdR [Diaporthe amygdali]|uniref:Fusaridione A cluster transcription factor fsdR n=1 Tax=Phomopsis amygdali TaxID=1214568 RepID=UPI0022FDD603|nr:Fusaridione A cluster transcription factor fsdR [Diaporthe amygdali]KAJ0123628.1 Fusaridione A cluster transcription factor fsdR [Diaporthe amygdali]